MTTQLTHSSGGHRIGVAGVIYEHPPWWSIFWFGWASLGTVAVAVLLSGVACAILFRRDPLTWMLVASLVGPVVFHCVIAGVTLPTYWFMWWPVVLMLSVAGWASVVVDGTRYPGRRLGSVAVVVVLGVIVLPGFVTLIRLAPEGANGVALARAGHHLDGAILATGTYVDELRPALPEATVLTTMPEDLTGIDTVVVGTPRCRTDRDPVIRALVQVNLAARRLVVLDTNRTLITYGVVAPLVPPTAAQIAQQPPVDQASLCTRSRR